MKFGVVFRVVSLAAALPSLSCAAVPEDLADSAKHAAYQENLPGLPPLVPDGTECASELNRLRPPSTAASVTQSLQEVRADCERIAAEKSAFCMGQCIGNPRQGQSIPDCQTDCFDEFRDQRAFCQGLGQAYLPGDLGLSQRRDVYDRILTLAYRRLSQRGCLRGRETFCRSGFVVGTLDQDICQFSGTACNGGSDERVLFHRGDLLVCFPEDIPFDFDKASSGDHLIPPWKGSPPWQIAPIPPESMRCEYIPPDPSGQDFSRLNALSDFCAGHTNEPHFGRS